MSDGELGDEGVHGAELNPGPATGVPQPRCRNVVFASGLDEPDPAEPFGNLGLSPFRQEQRKPSGTLVRSSKAVPPHLRDGAHARIVTSDQVSVNQRSWNRAHSPQGSIAVVWRMPEFATHDDVRRPV